MLLVYLLIKLNVNSLLSSENPEGCFFKGASPMALYPEHLGESQVFYLIAYVTGDRLSD